MLQISNHFYKTYKAIKPSDIVKNDKKIKRSYDPLQPFEELIEQIKDVVDFAATGNAADFPKQVVIIAYNLNFQTSFF